jgi:hypothetical protein
MMTKWYIKSVSGEGCDDEGNIIDQDRWEISDGVTTMIFPVADYPTEDDAWKAWQDRLM